MDYKIVSDLCRKIINLKDILIEILLRLMISQYYIFI